MRPSLLRAHTYFRAGTSPTLASYKRDVFFARRTGSSFLNQGRIEDDETQNTSVEGARSATRRGGARRAPKKAPGGGARGNERGQEAPGVGLGAHPFLLNHDGGPEDSPGGQGRGAHRWGVLGREPLLRGALRWPHGGRLPRGHGTHS